MQEKKRQNRPKGVLIIGSLLILFGALSLSSYFAAGTDGHKEMFEKFSQTEQHQLTRQQMQAINKISLASAAFLLLSGTGIIYCKEFARKAVVYFSLFIICLFLLTALVHPASLVFSFPQFLFFSLAALYFTNKDVKKFFLAKQAEENK